MNLIVCVDVNWAIGNQNELLVNIPADKRFFKEMTSGGVVLGGRRTMEGLPGRTTLKGRTNIVLTRQRDYQYGDALVVHSVAEALGTLRQYAERQIYIIGGGEVYQEFLPYCDHAYVTKVNHAYEADTFFPDLDQNQEWELIQKSEEQTDYDLEYYFYQYHRKK